MKTPLSRPSYAGNQSQASQFLSPINSSRMGSMGIGGMTMAGTSFPGVSLRDRDSEEVKP